MSRFLGALHNLNNYNDYLATNFYQRIGLRTKFKDPKRQEILRLKQLTESQKREIDQYYLNYYGKRIPYLYHHYNYSFTGQFDVKYMPEDIHDTEFELIVDPPDYSEVFKNKNFLPMLTAGISGLKIPKTILSNSAGIFTNGAGEIMTRSEAAEYLSGVGRAFIKPTIDSGSGDGCQIIDFSQTDILPILQQYRKDYVVQEILNTSDYISRLHPSSVNTFRVITYRAGDELFCAPLLMRIGTGNSYLDNAHAGGVFIGISNDGYLQENAYTEMHSIYKVHPSSGITFKGYHIPKIDVIIEKALTLHSRLPMLGSLNWDFTLDDENDPVLVECNIRGGGIWLSQFAWGKGAFEENTGRILEYIRDTKKKFPFKYR